MAAAPVKLILGTDRSQMRAVIAEHRSSYADDAITVVAARAGTAGEVLAETMSMGLFAAERLYIVHGVDEWNAADVDAFLKWKGNPPPDVVMLLTAAELRSNSRLYKAFSGSSLIKVAAPADQRALEQWVSQRFTNAGAAVSRDVCTALVRIVGSDSLDRLQSDIDRLIAWAGGETITPAHVEALATPHVADEKVWALTDAWATRDRSQFMRMSQQLLEQGEEPFRLVVVLARHFRSLSDAVRLLGRTTPGQAMNQLVDSGTNKWVARRLIEQAQRLSQPRVDAAFARSVMLEAELKGASTLASGRIMGDRPAHHIVFHRALLELA